MVAPWVLGISVTAGVVITYIVVGVVATKWLPSMPWTCKPMTAVAHDASSTSSGTRAAAGTSRLQKGSIAFTARRIAHRGGSLNAPENTMWAFRNALEHGAQMLEIDVCLSKDGVVVVAHDHDLSRVCDGNPKTVSDFNFADLPPLGNGIPLHFGKEVFQQSPEMLAANAGRFCSLREVFEEFPETPVHLDCKFISAEMVTKVLAMIDEFGRRSLTIVGAAMNPNAQQIYDRAAEIRREITDDDCRRSSRKTTPPKHAAAVAPPIGGRPTEPSAGIGPSTPLREDVSPSSYTDDEAATAAGDLAAGDKKTTDGKTQHGKRRNAEGRLYPLLTFSSARQVITTYLLFYTGLLPWVSVPYDVLDIPLPTQRLKRLLGRPVLAALVGCFLNTPSMWQHLQRRGVKVYGFVLNAEDEFNEVADWPIDGVMTDDAELQMRWATAAGRV